MMSSSNVPVTDRGHGYPVVLLPGSLMDRHMFNPQIARLRRDYRAIAPDLPDRNRDDMAPFTVTDTAGEVIRLLDDLGIGQCVIAGASSGAFTAIDVTRLHGDRVTALILIGATARAMPTGRRTEFAEVIAALDAEGDVPKDIAEWWAELSFAPLTHRSNPELVAEWTSRWMKLPARIAHLELAAWVDRADQSMLLRQLDLPALVLHGTDDHLFSFDRGASPLAAALPQSRLVPIAGAGNLLTLEKPDAANDAMLRFLRAELY